MKISDILNNELCDNEFRFGVVFMLILLMLLSDYNRHINFTPNINEFKSYVDTIDLLSDGDGPEDWSGGYLICSNKISWGSGIRIIIHILLLIAVYIMMVEMEEIIHQKDQN